MSIAITEEQRAMQDSIRDWAAGSAARSGTADVRALEPGARGSESPLRGAPWHEDPGWKELAGLGVFAMAVSEPRGGAGGGITDLAAALEQTAKALVPGPVLTTALAGVLLDRLADDPAATPLERIADGAASVGAAWRPGGLVAADSGSGIEVSGEADLVLGAANVSHLLLPASTPEGGEVWFLVAADDPAVAVTERAQLDFSRSLGRITVDSVHIGPEMLLPASASEQVRDAVATLVAAEASGVAAWCLDAAVEHARVREQFGRVIGSFQAVKHLCAEMLCRVEQASSLAWNAARAWEQGSGELPLAASAAAATVLDVAVDNAKDCVQVLGGTGFTWEHDAHLYLRRATALRQLFGTRGRESGASASWRGRVADLALGGARRSLAEEAGELPEDVRRQRPQIRAEVERIAELEPQRRRVPLADSGYLAPQWPSPYGHDASPALQLLIDEELARAGVRRPDLVVGAWAVPTILRHGTDAQRDEFVMPTLRGETTWCQLFSEPGAGSDLASLRTSASREPGGWRLNGQKVWTSVARDADWAICLARTDPDAPQHRGITYFLVDMASAGIEIRPLRDITGQQLFNEVFLDGVFVPDERVVGEPGEGWRLARTTLANERVAISGGSSLGEDVERVLERARVADLGAMPEIRERIGGLVADGLSVSLLGLRTTLRQLRGQQPGPESSVAKLLGVRHRQDVSEMDLELLGPGGAAVDDDSDRAIHEFLNTRCLSIAGGTTQILRNLAAERILGLPRES